MSFNCLECGYRFPSTAAAELAVGSVDGCPECGGTDIDEADALVGVARCPDCGEPGQRTGHQTCQYPGKHDTDHYAAGSWL